MDVPPAARSQSQLSRVDYADAFAIANAAVRERSAEEWARAVLLGAPAGFLRLWSASASLGVLPRSGGAGERSVVGWVVRHSTPDVALLAAGSRVGFSAELIFTRGPEELLLITLVRFENRFARLLWRLLAPVHRRVAANLLERSGSG